MRISGSQRFRNMSLALSFVLILSTTTISALLTALTPFVQASPEVTVSLDPTLNSKNPHGNFTISIDIAGVTNLYAWSVKIGWKTGLLTCIDAQEGSFLKGGGTSFFTWGSHTKYVDLACSLLGAGGASGSGTLANATFQVEDTGNCTLNLYDVTLLEYVPPLTIIDDWDDKDSPDDSYFYTTLPKAIPVSDSPYNNYFYTPNFYQAGHPIAGETLTFNASACYDPDDPYDPSPGGIVSYQWDFGDGTIVTENDPITTHVYSTNGTYTGNLTIIDDDGEIDTESLYLCVKLHDIAIIRVTATPTEVKVGETVYINVTVSNEGSNTEHLNVTVYYDNTPIKTKLFQYIWYDDTGNPLIISHLPPGARLTMTWGTTTDFQPLMWNTTGITPGRYTIGAQAFLVNQANLSQALTDIEADLVDNVFIDGTVQVALEPISVYTDKYSYSTGDTMHLGLDINNPLDSPITVCVAIWAFRPDNSIYILLHAHAVTLPASLTYSNPDFETFVLPSIPSGVYTWHAALVDPATHTILIEDTAEWQFI